MPQSGIDNVLDRLFNKSAMDRLAEAEATEQFETRPQGLPDMPPVGTLPQFPTRGAGGEILSAEMFAPPPPPPHPLAFFGFGEQGKAVQEKLRKSAGGTPLGKFLEEDIEVPKGIIPGIEGKTTRNKILEQIALTPLIGEIMPIGGAGFIKGAGQIIRKSPKVLEQTAKQEVQKTERAIANLTDLLKERKPATEARKVLRKAVAAKQAGQLEEIQRTFTTGEEFIQRGFAKLRGGIPKVEFEPIPKKAFSSDDFDRLVRHIADSPVFEGDPWRKLRLADALKRKLLGWGKPRGGVQLQPQEYKDMEKLFGFDFAEAIRKHGAGAKIGRTIMDLLGIPKAVKATADISYTLRQTLPLGLAEPKTWGREFGRELKSFASETYFDDAMLTLKAHPEFNFARKAGLEFTEAGKGVAQVFREETFPTRFAKWLPLVRRSERAAVSISNGMRFSTFYKYRELFGEVYKDDETWKQLAHYLNAATGRGNLGKSAVAVSTYLNRLFFSPRYQISLFQNAAYPFLYIKNPIVRKMAIRSWLGFVGLNASLVGIGKVSGLWDVELDPRSTDFGRVRIGDTRVDLMGAYRGWVNLISRLATVKTKVQAGYIKELNRQDLDDLVLQFLRGKTDPVVGALWSLMVGKTFVGEEFPPKEEDRGRIVAEQLLPFAILDVTDAYTTDGMTGAFMGATGVLGTSVASYPSRTFDTWADWVSEVTGKQWTNEELMAIRQDFNSDNGEWLEYYDQPTAKARQLWRDKHPEQEALMYFWGELSGLSTKESVVAFNRLKQQYGMADNLFPIQKQKDPFEEKGMKPEEVFFSLVETVPSYFSDYLIEHKDFYPEVEIPGVIRQWELAKREDDSVIKRYYMETKDMDTKQREIYRRANPEMDAALNFWGRVSTLQSEQAIAELNKKARLLGVPKEILPFYTRKQPAQKSGFGALSPGGSSGFGTFTPVR